MRNLFLLVVLVLVVLTACQPTGGNDSNSGVLPSGFSYYNHPSGNSTAPEVGQYVFYQAKLGINGEIQQDTRTAPTMPFMKITPPLPDSVPQPRPNIVLEILRKMNLGDSATVTVPIADAPFIRGLNPTDTLSYEIVIKEILNEDAFQIRREEEIAKQRTEKERTQQLAISIDEEMNKMLADYRDGKLDDQLQTTDAGLKYLVQEQGDGSSISTDDFVSVHYYGKILDGTTFDNSYDKGNPITFPIGQGRVITGWDQGIPLFNQGGKGYLFIPGDMAYGNNPPPGSPIQPGAELVFQISIVDVRVNTLKNRQAQ